jgi:hypothetical protein
VDPDEKPQNAYSFRDDSSDSVVNVSHSNRSRDEGNHHNDLIVARGKTRSCYDVEEDSKDGTLSEESMTVAATFFIPIPNSLKRNQSCFCIPMELLPLHATQFDTADIPLLFSPATGFRKRPRSYKKQAAVVRTALSSPHPIGLAMRTSLSPLSLLRVAFLSKSGG